MLKLIQELANCDEKFFRGWLLVKANMQILGTAHKFTHKILWQRQRKCLILVEGFNNDGKCMQSLQVLLLLLPKSLTINNLPINDEVIYTLPHIISQHTFTKREIDDYILLSGDKNIIHQGANPIVPGLCMVYFLAQNLHQDTLHWQIRFNAKVYAEDKIIFTKEAKHIKAYANDKLVFSIKIL